MVNPLDAVEAWNIAIRDEIYSLSRAGQNVYLDLDDEVVDRILSHPALHGKNHDDLYKDVANIINFNAPADLMLESLRIRSWSWIQKVMISKDPNEVPPMLAFLAVTVAAAEEMGTGDVDANAYYSHLCRLLDLNPESSDARKLQEAYRGIAEPLWGYLNRWLIDIRYSRGVPTAYAISQRFVGIPVSQALVREIDRNRLPTMFQFFGLKPLVAISAPEMEELVTLWIQRDDHQVSAGLRKLWLNAQARAQISAVFCDELEKWEGSAGGSSAVAGIGQPQLVHNRKLKLGAWFSNQMGNKALHISLLAPASLSMTQDEFNLKLAQGTEIPFEKLNDDYCEAKGIGKEAIEAICNSILELEDSTGQSFRREPTTIIAMQFDEQNQGFVETKKLQAGHDALLLVKDHNNLLIETKAFLDRNSRHGYEMLGPGTRGIPAGWWCFRNVQITDIDNQLKTAVEKEVFSALVPSVNSQILVSGGVKLPGFRSLSQWLVGFAPELRAISQTSTSVALIIEKSDQIGQKPEPLHEIESSEGILLQDLQALNLGPGDYVATMFEDGKPTTSRRFSLATGDEPDYLLKMKAERLAHDFGKSASEAISGAIKTLATEGVVLGALTTSKSRPVSANAIFAKTEEWDQDAEIPTSVSGISLELETLGLDSCFYRGNHNWLFPTYKPHEKIPPTVIVVCQKCKSMSLQYQSFYLAEREKENPKFKLVREARSNPRSEARITPTEEKDLFDWKVVRVILNYSVAGSYKSLVDTLKQLSETQYTANEIIEFVEQLGHIEVERDAMGRGVYWRITPTQIIPHEAEENAYFLLGATPKSLIQSIFSACKDLGLEPSITSSGLLTKIANLTRTQMKTVSTKMGIDFVEDAAEKLASSLPALGDFLSSAKREVLPDSSEISMFDLDSGAWIETDAMSVGAMRLTTNFGFKYFYVVDTKDLTQGMGISCSATMAKYLSAHAVEKCLFAYKADKSAVYTPLGAKLPGLYARPLLLSSFTPPRKVKMTRKDGSTYSVYKYTDVSETVAQELANRLIG